MVVMEIPENGAGATRLRAAIRDQWEGLSTSERAVAQYLVSAPVGQLLFVSAQELGAASSTSNATVVRALQRLGYAGLPALKRELANDFTAAVAPEERLKQRIAHVGQDLESIWTDVFDEAQDRIDHTRRLTEPEALKRSVTALAEAREVFCYGIAASNRAPATWRWRSAGSADGPASSPRRASPSRTSCWPWSRATAW